MIKTIEENCMDYSNSCNHHNGKTTRVSTCQPKQFKERKSLLTELSDTKHFLALKHIFYCMLLGLLLKDLVFSFVLNKRVNYGLRCIALGFAKFHIFLILWCITFSVNLLTFYLFNVWIDIRLKISPNLLSRIVILDYIFLCLVVAYYIGALLMVPTMTISFDLPALCAGSLLTEQVRMLMKSHAFVRRNVPDILAYKPHTEKKLLRPSFTHYLYFSFSPTLVYRHEYPRTKNTNWTIVAQSFQEMAICLWLISYMVDFFFISKFEKADTDNHAWKDLIVIILEGVVGGFVIVVLVFYSLLHNWMNGFAEILRFGDRKFYDDWWTATSFQSYFRKWNIVVQDWLYEYIYKDFYEIITPNSKIIPKIMVFLISAIAHEYILTIALKQFFPFLFVSFFIFGMIFSFVNTKRLFYNILFLYSISFGFSMNISFYVMEAFARKNCPILEYNTTVSSFTPRIFSRECIAGF